MQILRDYEFTEEEIDYALNQGYETFCTENEKNGIELSASEYIRILIQNTPKWEAEQRQISADNNPSYSESKIDTAHDDDLPF